MESLFITEILILVIFMVVLLAVIALVMVSKGKKSDITDKNGYNQEPEAEKSVASVTVSAQPVNVVAPVQAQATVAQQTRPVQAQTPVAQQARPVQAQTPVAQQARPIQAQAMTAKPAPPVQAQTPVAQQARPVQAQAMAAKPAPPVQAQAMAAKPAPPTINMDADTINLSNLGQAISNTIGAEQPSEYRVILTEPKTEKVYVKTSFDKVTIGRNGATNDIVLDHDKTVSGNHCQIIQRNGQVYIEDVGSANGTIFNEERLIGRKGVSTGDVVVIGDGLYVIEIERVDNLKDVEEGK